MRLWASFFILCALAPWACDERWSPGNGTSSCALDQPILRGALWDDTLGQRGWLAGCLRVKGTAPAPVFAAAVKLGKDGHIWAYDGAKEAPLQLRLPPVLRSGSSSFLLIIPGQGVQGNAAKSDYDLEGLCQQFTGPETPCERRAEANSCWFSMALRLSLPDGSQSRAIDGYPTRACVLYAPNEDAEGKSIDGSPGEVIFPDTPSDCMPGETRACQDYLPCPGLQTCRGSGVWGDCLPNSSGSEICDGLDNNCNGVIDENCGPSACMPSQAYCVETILGQPGSAGDADGARDRAGFRQPEDMAYNAVHRLLFVSDHIGTGGGRLRLVQVGERSSPQFGQTTTLSLTLKDAGGLASIKSAPSLAGVLVSQPGQKSGFRLDVNVSSKQVQIRAELAFPDILRWGVASDELLGERSFFAGNMALYVRSSALPKIEKIPMNAGIFGVAAHIRASLDYDLYYTTASCIRRYSVTLTSRADKQFAGDCSSSGNRSGSVDEALFGTLGDIAISPNKQVLYVSDRDNHKLWMIHVRQGKVWSLTGESASTAGYADGVAAFAKFNEPVGLDVGGDGYLYVADRGNHVIRRLKLP